MKAAGNLACCLIPFTVLVAGCPPINEPGRGNAELSAWVVSDMVALTDQTEQFRDTLVFDAVWQNINLHAGANETVSFQLVIDAGQRRTRKLEISWSDLVEPSKHRIDKSNIRAFRGLPLQISKYPPWYLRLVDLVPQPAKFYDPLVPLDAPKAGQPFDLAPGERLMIWFDVAVPRDARAGNYLGKLTISSATHGSWSFNLAVKVHDFVLPDARPVAAVGGFDHQEVFAAFLEREGKPYIPKRLDRSQPLVRRGLVIIRQLMRLAHEHRIDLFDKRIGPILKRDALGKVRLDWEDYDAIVMPYLNGTAFDDRLGCPAWPMPFCESWPDPEKYGGVETDAYATTVGGLLTESRRHFGQSPETAERMFIWPYRLRANYEAYERYEHLARIARAADNQTPLLCQLPVNPPQAAGWRVSGTFKKLVDISAPPAQWFDPASAADAARADNPLVGVWLSPGMPPYLPSLGVIATPADVRAVPWFAMKYKCTGLFLPEALHWRSDPFAPEASQQTRLFYPGTTAGLEEVLPSVRLKRLRRGLQDIIYLWVLQQRGREEIGKTIIDGVVRYGGLDAVGDNYLDARLDGWVQDPAVWYQARRLLAAELLQVIHPSQLSGKQLLEQRLAWRSFDEKAHRVRVEQVRCRVRPVPGERAGEGELLEMTIELDLYNEFGRDVDVAVRIESLPGGWKITRSAIRLSPLRAARRAVVELKARGTHIPATAGAKMRVPVSITTNLKRRDVLDVLVPFILAGPVSEPPKVDGVLDDWPMRAGNTAGAFKLIGRRGRSGDGLAQRQTLAFVLCDGESLYIAFRCDEPKLDAIVAQPSNIIHYEQLMACGEDLIEVILDPGADARGPDDLYHIIVKPNGVLLTERGVHTDPPLGRARPWPVSALVAIGKQKGTWTAELAIPLSAFRAEGRARLWGVNFTRFATQGAEASSWSGAPRYFYDPKNLGTMFVAPTAAR
ncbi:MAG: hypothetical protein ACYTF6_05460 [Planctomycetota bacterium]|jgi:hypothetical protein